MATYRMIPVEEEQVWSAMLQRCGIYDVYHGAAYHALPGEGDAYLFSYESDCGAAALPVVIRPIPGSAYRDITSVYGYAGVVASIAEHDVQAERFRAGFQAALLKMIEEWRIVTLFSRMNPFIASGWLLEGIAEVRELGLTVAIDLRKSEQERLADMSKGHRYDIRKARNDGVSVSEDCKLEQLDSFIRIYNETMLRNAALPSYYFPKEYYLTLKRQLGDSCRLFIAQREGVVISAAFFLIADRIINYHLSGSSAAWRQYAGAKLILDEVAQWGAGRGASFLHLGGGVGAQEDPLYGFKKGFSSLRQRFSIIRMIGNQAVYRELVKTNASSGDYFPLYRKPR